MLIFESQYPQLQNPLIPTYRSMMDSVWRELIFGYLNKPLWSLSSNVQKKGTRFVPSTAAAAMGGQTAAHSFSQKLPHYVKSHPQTEMTGSDVKLDTNQNHWMRRFTIQFTLTKYQTGKTGHIRELLLEKEPGNVIVQSTPSEGCKHRTFLICLCDTNYVL